MHSRTQIEGAITEWIHSELDRSLLSRRMLDGVTIEALAEEHGRSVSCVKRRLKKAGNELKLHL